MPSKVAQAIANIEELAIQDILYGLTVPFQIWSERNETDKPARSFEKRVNLIMKGDITLLLQFGQEGNDEGGSYTTLENTRITSSLEDEFDSWYDDWLSVGIDEKWDLSDSIKYPIDDYADVVIQRIGEIWSVQYMKFDAFEWKDE